MKRRNTKKYDSFDFIKMSSKREPALTHWANLREAELSCFTPLLNLNSREKNSVELPKIHTLCNAKIRRERDLSHDTSNIDSRFLLFGNQMKKDQEQSKNEKNKDVSYKRRTIEKESAYQKKLMPSTILIGFGIGSVVFEKRKILAYVEEGNNSRMVREMMRKRFQISFVSDKKEANLVWTRFCDYESSKLQSKLQEEDMSEDYVNSSNEKSPKLNEEVRTNHSSSHLNSSNQNSLSMLLYNIHTLNTENRTPEQRESKQKITIQDFKIHNHITNHYEISDKKSLFNNLKKYCAKNRINIFDLVPVTYEIQRETDELPNEIGDESYWFIKPGEDTNRGQGISIGQGRNQIRGEVDNLLKQGKTALVQQYIDPLLYKGRKFDIRCYALAMSYRGELKAYWYQEGYIRTCSKEFTYDISDTLAHLTNDAVQKKSQLYGKYEQSNKLSYGDLDAYLKTKEFNFKGICEEMKKLALVSIKSVAQKLKGEKNQFNFEIFGYDFLIDKKGKCWLIEINTNPCLEFTGSLTSRVIGHMIDNSFKLVLDPLLGNELSKEDFQRSMEDNKYECII